LAINLELLFEVLFMLKIFEEIDHLRVNVANLKRSTVMAGRVVTSHMKRDFRPLQKITKGKNASPIGQQGKANRAYLSRVSDCTENYRRVFVRMKSETQIAFGEITVTICIINATTLVQRSAVPETDKSH
jgi:hypothetical protein